MKARISAPLRESRLPVGSSAKTTCGRPARARATATRCCWPPESSDGPVAEAVAEADGVDDAVEPRLVRLPAGEGQREGDVLEGGEGRHQVERLEHEPDPVAAQQGELPVGQPAEVDVADEDLARR